MPEGITILSEKLVEIGGTNPLLLIIGFIIIGIGLGLTVLCCSESELYLAIPFTMIMILLGIVMIVASNKSKESYTEYKVLISEDVSYSNLTENYTVESQEGLIYTLRDK